MPTHRELDLIMTTSTAGGVVSECETRERRCTSSRYTSNRPPASLAEPQLALRRVAALVARRSPPEEVFAAAMQEIAQLAGVQFAHLGRYELDDAFTFVAASGGSGAVPVGSHLKLGGDDVTTVVATTGRSARIDDYSNGTGAIAAAARKVGGGLALRTPVVVEDRLWGVMVARPDPHESLPADTDARLVKFTELLATAIANAESRAQLNASRVRIVAAGDEMRRRIERDLHDGAQQQLVSLMLELRKPRLPLPSSVRTHAKVPAHCVRRPSRLPRRAVGTRYEVNASPPAELLERRAQRHPRLRQRVGGTKRWPFDDLPAHEPGVNELAQPLGEHGLTDPRHGAAELGETHGAFHEHTEDAPTPALPEQREDLDEVFITTRVHG
jgi:GAF domain/Histidine kinase